MFLSSINRRWGVIVITVLLITFSLLTFHYYNSSSPLRSIASGTQIYYDGIENEKFLDNLLISYDSYADFSGDYESAEAMYRLGDVSHEFISDANNLSLFKTAKGRRLLANFQKLRSSIVAAKIVTTANNNNRQLSQRILVALFKLTPTAVKNPLAFILDERGFRDFKQSVTRAIATAVSKDNFNTIRWGIVRGALEGSVENYANFEYYFSGIEASNIKPSEVAVAICLHPKYKLSMCDTKTQDHYTQMVRQDIEQLEAMKAPQWSAISGAEYLNARIRELNEVLGQVDLRSKERDSQLKRYHEKYYAVASLGPGLLMMTDHLQKVMGEARMITSFLTKTSSFFKGQYGKLSPHKEITAVDFIIAFFEAKKKIVEHMVYLKDRDISGVLWDAYKMNGAITDSKHMKLTTGIITELLAYNPVAVARLIVDRPDLASYVKYFIDETTRLDIRAEKINKAYVYSSLIVGLALTATGVGASVGGWLLAPAAVGTAAASTAATLGTISTIAGASGTMLGIGNGFYYTGEAMKAKNQHQKLEHSILAGNNDEYGMYGARETIKKYRKALVNASIRFGLSGVDIIRGIRATSVGDSVEDMTNYVDTLNTASSSSEGISKTRMLVDQIGPEKTSKFFGLVTMAKDSVRKAILSEFADSSVTPAMFTQMAKEALAGVK